MLRTAEWTLAKVREHARAGVLIDAFADPGFCIQLVNGMSPRMRRQPFAGGELRFERTAAMPGLDPVDLERRRASRSGTDEYERRCSAMRCS